MSSSGSVSTVLVRKEWDLVYTQCFWLGVFTLTTLWINSLLMEASGGMLSHLSLTTSFASPVLIIIAFALSQILVVREYSAGTQRFVESLPISKLHLATVKFFVGLALTLTFAFTVLFLSIYLARQEEGISATFVLLLCTRLFFYCLALWSLVFAFSFLGRLRVIVIGASVLFVFFLDSKTDFVLDRFGPLALINDQLFTSERESLPVLEIVESILVAAVALALVRILLLYNEGSLVERLSTKMNRGEKAFLVVLVFMGVSLLAYLDEDTIDTVPELGTSHVLRDDAIVIAYLDPAFKQDATQLASYLDETFDVVRSVVALPDDFLIRIVLAPRERIHKFQTVFTSQDDGISATANFSLHQRGIEENFSAFVVHQALFARSNHRFTLETYHAMLDGFSLWASRAPDKMGTIEDGVDLALLQALYAHEKVSITSESTRNWDETHEAIGDTLGLSLAYSGWWVMEQRLGKEKVLAYARREFNRDFHEDIRDWWQDFLAPQPVRFEEATGLAWDEFLTYWEEDLIALKQNPNYARALSKAPHGDTLISAINEPGSGVGIAFDVDLTSPLSEGSECIVLHGRLPGYYAASSDIPARPTTFEVGAQSEIHYELKGDYGRGSRVFVALECELPQFPMPIRLGSARVTLP